MPKKERNIASNLNIIEKLTKHNMRFVCGGGGEFVALISSSNGSLKLNSASKGGVLCDGKDPAVGV